jgi:YidC/Oxa1 family membrane protein insertase
MDNIRFLLVIAFAMIVLLLWQAWQKDYGPQPAIAQIENPAIADVKEDLPATTNTVAQAQSDGQPVTTAPLAAVSSAAIVTVKTDVIALEIDMQGGTIQNLDLLNYPVEKDNTIVNSMRKLVGLEAAEKNRKAL